MAKLVFLRRAEKDYEVFGGDIYFDIDGKNVGIFSRNNQEIYLPAGQHTVKMYRSHSYDTFIGFASSTITIDENENLMVQYAAPMMLNQPGNIIITTYDSFKEMELLKAREQAISRDYAADEMRKKDQNKKYNTGVIMWITCMIIVVIFFAIWEVFIWL